MKRILCGLVSAAVTAMVLAVPGLAAGDDHGVAQVANGVVQVYAETQRSDGSVYSGIGSAFGVGTVGEETDIFITNRHVVTVENEDGSELGTLQDVIATGANDVYDVRLSDGRQVLIPAIRECILSVDVEEGRMRVHLLDGLL